MSIRNPSKLFTESVIIDEGCVCHICLFLIKIKKVYWLIPNLVDGQLDKRMLYE